MMVYKIRFDLCFAKLQDHLEKGQNQSEISSVLTLYHTIPTVNDPRERAFDKIV